MDARTKDALNFFVRKQCRKGLHVFLPGYNILQIYSISCTKSNIWKQIYMRISNPLVVDNFSGEIGIDKSVKKYNLSVIFATCYSAFIKIMNISHISTCVWN